MSSLTCENCGTVNPGNVKFCKQCGERLSVPDRENQDQVCSKCGFVNPPKATHCKQCHINLSVIWDPGTWDAEARKKLKQQRRANPRVTVREQTSSRSTPSPGLLIESRYHTLRSVANICRIGGYVLGGLIAVYGLFTTLSMIFDSFLLAVAVLIGSLIGAGIMLIYWLIIAESISVLLDIEENTRQTALLLRQGS